MSDGTLDRMTAAAGGSRQAATLLGGFLDWLFGGSSRPLFLYYLGFMLIPGIEIAFALALEAWDGYGGITARWVLAVAGVKIAVNLLGAYVLIRPIELYLRGRGDFRAARRRAFRLPELSAAWALMIILLFEPAQHLGTGFEGDALYGRYANATYLPGLFAIIEAVYFAFLMNLIMGDFAGRLRGQFFQGYRLEGRGMNSRVVLRLVLAILVTSILPVLMVLHDVVYSDLIDIKRNVIGIATGALVSTTLVAIALVRATIRPIDVLLDAVREVRGNNLSVSVPVTTRDEIGVLTTAFNAMVEGLRERELAREAFGDNLSGEDARAVLDQGDVRAGTGATATVMVVDFRDFGVMSQGMTPANGLALLNDFLRVVVSPILGNGGVVVNVIADKLVAVFNLPIEDPNHCRNAIKAAVEIAHILADQSAESGIRMAAAIGIATGPVVAGLVGPEKNKAYTVMGPTMTRAFQLSRINPMLGTTALLSVDTVYGAAGAYDVRSLGEHMPPQSADAIEVFLVDQVESIGQAG